MGVLGNKAQVCLSCKYLLKVYDRVNPFIWSEEMRDEVLEMLDIQQGGCVLGVGCGTGFGTEGLFRYTDDVHGLDQGIHQTQKAWEKFDRHDEVRFCRGDVEWLFFAENLFDVIWSSGLIEYWPNPVTTLEESRRVMKPGSKVLVVGPDGPKSGVFQKLAGAIVLFYDKEEADRMFKAAGFVGIEHHTLQYQPGSPRAIITIVRVPEE